MEMGGVISRKVTEARLVPEVRVSNISKKPPSRYGIINSLGHDLFSGDSNKWNTGKIGCKIGHRRGCSLGSFSEEP